MPPAAQLAQVPQTLTAAPCCSTAPLRNIESKAGWALALPSSAAASSAICGSPPDPFHESAWQLQNIKNIEQNANDKTSTHCSILSLVDLSRCKHLWKTTTFNLVAQYVE